MHILVATDGALDPDRAADAVARWYKEGDTVEVFTAVNVPTDFLRRLGDSGVEAASQIALEAGQGFTAGDRAAEQLATKSPHQELHGDSPVLKALASTAKDRTRPIVDALRERGVKAKDKWSTSENRTAKTVLAAAKARNAELLVIGSHGQGRFEGVLGSTGTKLVRLAPGAVLVIRHSED
jgi:nucleotide-binding universal stress UspA family protein